MSWEILTSLGTSFFEMGERFNGIMGVERAVFEENAGLKGVTHTHKKELTTTYICAVEE